jgi:hypothetical protein
VPASVTVLGGQQLEQIGAVQFQDYARLEETRLACAAYRTSAARRRP